MEQELQRGETLLLKYDSYLNMAAQRDMLKGGGGGGTRQLKQVYKKYAIRFISTIVDRALCTEKKGNISKFTINTMTSFTKKWLEGYLQTHWSYGSDGLSARLCSII